jgi:flagellar hook assembly protein FlgD
MTVLQLDPVAVQEEAPTVTAGTFLERNVPNPFSQSTDLRFRLEQPGEATIQIVDVSGRVVRRLGGRSFPGGYSEIRWDGRDASGHEVAPGVYLAQLRAGRQISARRVIVAR